MVMVESFLSVYCATVSVQAAVAAQNRLHLKSASSRGDLDPH